MPDYRESFRISYDVLAYGEDGLLDEKYPKDIALLREVLIRAGHVTAIFWLFTLVNADHIGRLSSTDVEIHLRDLGELGSSIADGIFSAADELDDELRKQIEAVIGEKTELAERLAEFFKQPEAAKEKEK